MSGVLLSLLGERAIESLVPGPGGDRLVRFQVFVLRELGLEVVHAPLDDDSAHVHIVGEKSRQLRRVLAEIAVFVV
jgi:hypothetical protein